MNLSQKCKLLVLLCVACSFTLLSNAQKFQVTWAEKVKMKFDYSDAISLANGQTIVLKYKHRNAALFSEGPTTTTILMLVDKEMQTIIEKVLPIEEKYITATGLQKYGNSIFFLYDTYDKSSKTTSVYAIRINEKTITQTEKILLGNYASDSREDQAEVEYKLSSDSSKILLFVEGPMRIKENKQFYLGVFTNDLKKIWTRSVSLPILEKFVSIYDYDISNDGKALVAIKHYEKEVTREAVREDGDKIPSYIYKLLVYEDAKQKAKEAKLNLNNLFIQGTKLVYDKNGTMTVAGLYKQKSNGRITGVFYAPLDSANYQLKNPKTIAFDNKLLTMVDKDGLAKDAGADPGLNRPFKLRHMLSRENGSIDLIAEYRKVTDVNVYSGVSRRVRQITIFDYCDIVNTNINKKGEVTFTRIPKYQMLKNYTAFLSYYPILYKDKLILIYNDDKDNVTRSLDKRPDDVVIFAKGVLAAAIIDADGSLKREIIYNNDDEDYVPTPTYSEKMADGTYLLSAQLIKAFKKRTRYGTLKIE